MSTEWLFTAIVVTALAIITIVVIFGGVLVVKDDDYDFAEYLADSREPVVDPRLPRFSARWAVRSCRW